MEKQKISKEEASKLIEKYADNHIEKLKSKFKDHNEELDAIFEMLEYTSAWAVSSLIINDLFIIE